MQRPASLMAGLLLTCTSVLSSSARDDIQNDGEAAPPMTWRQAAEAAGLDAQAIEQLERDRFVISRREFKQIFDPYVESTLPVFITTDSLLAGYHVLLEESILRLEERIAGELPTILREMWERLERESTPRTERSAEVTRALLRARMVLGTAVQLLDQETPLTTGETQELINEEVARITAATEVMKPAWLGPPDPGFLAVDYSRYRVRGMYAGFEMLERYFRAVSWLQSIPFRISNDEEFRAILILAESARLDKGFPSTEEFERVLATDTELVGIRENWDLRLACAVVYTPRMTWTKVRFDPFSVDLKIARAILANELPEQRNRPEINDQFALPPSDPAVFTEPSIRVMSAARTPDSVMFQRTTDSRRIARPMPDGLEVCSALGSRSARARLAGIEHGVVNKLIDETAPFFQGESLYQEYLAALRTLLDGPEHDAPAFFSTAAWQSHNCQTTLAGWAQLRHTWALQAQSATGFFGGSSSPPGFIEPEPDFFLRMGELVERTSRILQNAKAFESNPFRIANRVDVIVRFCEEHEVEKLGFIDLFKGKAGWLPPYFNDVLFGLNATLSKRTPGDEPAETMRKLRELRDKLSQGVLPDDPELVRSLTGYETDYADLWSNLARICYRLAALAQKQLRDVPFTDADRHFLRKYGQRIASVMLYRGNSYLDSHDDAPRIIDVFSDATTGRVLEVGIGRPRAIYVLYPDAGQDVLCRGAVSTYYEFPSQTRLTDEEWKSLLDSPDRPSEPEWVPPVVNSPPVPPEEHEEFDDEDLDDRDVDDEAMEDEEKVEDDDLDDGDEDEDSPNGTEKETDDASR